MMIQTHKFLLILILFFVYTYWILKFCGTDSEVVIMIDAFENHSISFWVPSSKISHGTVIVLNAVFGGGGPDMIRAGWIAINFVVSETAEGQKRSYKQECATFAHYQRQNITTIFPKQAWIHKYTNTDGLCVYLPDPRAFHWRKAN